MRLALTTMITASVLLSGCGVARTLDTDYGSMTMTGGFSEKEVEPGVWRVIGRSNGVVRRGFGRDMAVYRAAEIMRQKGFASFHIVDQKGEAKTLVVNGSPRGSAGEYFKVWVVGDDGTGKPACRAETPNRCMTLDVPQIMAMLGPRLDIDPAKPVRPVG